MVWERGGVVGDLIDSYRRLTRDLDRASLTEDDAAIAAIQREMRVLYDQMDEYQRAYLERKAIKSAERIERQGRRIRMLRERRMEARRREEG